MNCFGLAPLSGNRSPQLTGVRDATSGNGHLSIFFQANDGKANGKATHALKVYFNGSPTKNSTEDDLTLVTYDGSTAEKKKATIERHKYHADAGKWHEVSVTFEGNEATVVVGRKTYTVTSERFLEPFEKIGVGHFSGTLETKELKLDKVR
jgi:hypothetical protein